jgi:hypothetical protein
VLPSCERATLAFCLDHQPRDAEPWLSMWAVVGKTFLRCRERLAALNPGAMDLEVLGRKPATNRFTGNLALAHLEAYWNQPQPFTNHESRFTRVTR